MAHLKIGSETFEQYNAQSNITRLACCGAAEFHGLGTWTGYLGTEGVAYKIADLFAQGFINGCFIFFTQVKGAGPYGDLLASFVEKNSLGKITKSNEKVNPNSSNTLTAFIWEVDRPALKDWYISKGVSTLIKARQVADPAYYADPKNPPTEVELLNARAIAGSREYSEPIAPPPNPPAAGAIGAAAIYDGNRLV